MSNLPQILFIFLRWMYEPKVTKRYCFSECYSSSFAPLAPLSSQLFFMHNTWVYKQNKVKANTMSITFEMQHRPNRLNAAKLWKMWATMYINKNEHNQHTIQIVIATMMMTNLRAQPQYVKMQWIKRKRRKYPPPCLAVFCVSFIHAFACSFV